MCRESVALRRTANRRHETDEQAARLLARARLLVLSIGVLVAELSFGEAEHPGLQYGLAFGAVPASAALALAADRLRPARSAAVGAAIDVATFAIVLLGFPDRVEALAPLLLVPVLLAGASGGRSLGLAVGAAGLTVLVGADAAGTLEVPMDVVLLLAMAVAVCVTVVGRADARLVRTSRSAHSFEARATTLLEQLAQPVVGMDATGHLTLVNDAARELLGDLQDDHSCAAVLQLQLRGEPVDCTGGCALRRVAGATGPAGVEATVCGSVPVLVSVAEVPSADGESIEYIHALRDITQLKRADEAKTLFLATATHELKTPLTVIRGFLDTIERPEVSDELRATAMGVMRSRANELGAIIDRILLASRIESGEVQVVASEVDAVAVSRERVAALAAATGRTISLRSSDGLPAALGDETMLATVVDHLVDNACKYSDAGAVVDVSVSLDDESVVVSVRDEGHGMTAEQAAHCFDRFWQADPTSRRRAGGTGIGLYIVRSLVESMRGTVGVLSTPGKGSTFRVALRRADVVVPSDDGASLDGVAGVAPEPEPSIVREFMRQIGVESREAIG